MFTRFRTTRAAIDLASIMVGVIVIGVVGGAIAATVLAAIPWAQTEAAKISLQSVTAAQAASRAQSGGYTSLDTLTQDGLLPSAPHLASDTSTDHACWLGFSATPSGDLWWLTNGKTTPTLYNPAISAADPGWCVPRTPVADLADRATLGPVFQNTFCSMNGAGVNGTHQLPKAAAGGYSKIEYNGSPTIYDTWWRNAAGQESRTDGASHLRFQQASDWYVCEATWMKNDNLYRPGDVPAKISYFHYDTPSMSGQDASYVDLAWDDDPNSDPWQGHRADTSKPSLLGFRTGTGKLNYAYWAKTTYPHVAELTCDSDNGAVLSWTMKTGPSDGQETQHSNATGLPAGYSCTTITLAQFPDVQKIVADAVYAHNQAHPVRQPDNSYTYED